MRHGVGVRELRQNLSVYLKRVKDGETLEVLDRGRPAALLIPLRAGESVLDRLIAEGLASPAKEDLRALPPPLKTKAGTSASRALRQQRAE
jgi:prevent-host-death family protein